MEARELRIGNWVKQGRANVQVTGAMIQEINQELLDVNPIPLTKGWLLKFEFDFFASNNIWQLNTELGFCIWGRIGNGLEVFVDINPCGISIKYVHQLQNLYFALTGEELTIKQS